MFGYYRLLSQFLRREFLCAQNGVGERSVTFRSERRKLIIRSRIMASMQGRLSRERQKRAV